MKILFVYSGTENLGIEYLSSVLKSKGHETALVFDPAVFSGDLPVNNPILGKLFSMDKKIVSKSIEYAPDIIAFSSYTGNYRWCLKIAKEIKQYYKVPIVFGGVHPTAVPEKVLENDFIDYVIIGEGEEAILDLVEWLQKKEDVKKLLKLPNLCFRYGGKKGETSKVKINSPRKYLELDSLPFPDKSLFYDKVPLWAENYLITASRGCPFSCTYCSNDMLHKVYCSEKRHLRKRSPKNVIEELKWAKSNWNIKLVKFVDDVFSVSQEWLEEFIPLYKSEINLPFFCIVHPNQVTREIANLLKSGGCYVVNMGVQSGSERIRKEVFKRFGSNERILESIQYIKEAGIKISLDNIFGAPSETEDDLKAGLDLYERAKPDRLIGFWLTYYPNTRIIDSALAYQCITESEVGNLNNGISGFTHGFGTVEKKSRNLYLKYQLLFQLRTLFHSDMLYRLSKVLIYLPFKSLNYKLVIFLYSLKNRDPNILYYLRYIWTKKNVP